MENGRDLQQKSQVWPTQKSRARTPSCPINQFEHVVAGNFCLTGLGIGTKTPGPKNEEIPSPESRSGVSDMRGEAVNNMFSTFFDGFPMVFLWFS